jgi:histone acetyltransferase (RNA polymerase elongator complex component)
MACPFRCIYCDQHKITGKLKLPDAADVLQTIENYLKTIPSTGAHIEVAFFGGNFTGLPLDSQKMYLDIAQNYLLDKRIHGIRLSTRPDYIDTQKLDLLTRYGVSTIELGAQSLDDAVLEQCGRGHTVADVETASNLIRQAGINLGLQMMIGLPGDKPEKAMQTAEKIVALEASESRIYPCLIIKGTALQSLFEQGKYQPLSMEEAVDWSARLFLYFETHGVKVIRLGLHPSTELEVGGLVGGPYHRAFKTLVLSKIWEQLLKNYNLWPSSNGVLIKVAPGEINFAVGFEAKNKKAIQQRYRHVKFVADSSLFGRRFEISSLAK